MALTFSLWPLARLSSVSVTFLMQLDLAQYGKLVLGLIIGGAMAAPLAGYLLRILPTRMALMLVGIVVAGLSLIDRRCQQTLA